MHTTIRILAPVILLASLFCLGCSDTPPLAEVRGEVTMNGKPLKNVRVDFHPNPDKGTKGKGSSGVTDADGKFTLTYDGSSPGAIVGHHRVIVSDLDLFGNVFVGRGDYRTDDPKGPKETPKKARFSSIYSDLNNSPILFEVKPGMEPVKIEVK